MKSSCNSLIPFLPFLLNRLKLPYSELHPFLDNNSLNFWQQTTDSKFHSMCGTLPYNHFARTTQKTHPLLLRCLLIRCLAMDVVLLRALTPAGMCLQSRCLEMSLCVYHLTTVASSGSHRLTELVQEKKLRSH
jgi:hypothetical protein